MPVYISILRGINVGGHNKIKMEELRKMYEALGYKNVTSYIQSGNIIYEAKKKSPEALGKEQTAAIRETFGHEVPVLVVDKETVHDILLNNPFLKNKKIDLEKLHVTLVASEPDKENVDKISKTDYLPDEWILEGKNIYLHCPVDYGNSKLINSFFEKKLKVNATTRNWKTLNKLYELADELKSN